MQTCFSKTQNQSRVNPWSQRIPHERYCSKNEPESPTPVHLQINDQGKQRATMAIVPVMYSTIPINDVLYKTYNQSRQSTCRTKYIWEAKRLSIISNSSVYCAFSWPHPASDCVYNQFLIIFVFSLANYVLQQLGKITRMKKRKQWQKNLQMKEYRIQERKNTKNKVRKEGFVFPKRSSRTKMWS